MRQIPTIDHSQCIVPMCTKPRGVYLSGRLLKKLRIKFCTNDVRYTEKSFEMKSTGKLKKTFMFWENLQHLDLHIVDSKEVR